MSRILTFCFVLFVMVLGLAFHLRNSQLVNLDYYLGSLELPFSLVVITALCLGALLGVFASMPLLIKLKRRNAKLSKQVKVSEKELNNLRVIPVKDAH